MKIKLSTGENIDLDLTQLDITKLGTGSVSGENVILLRLYKDINAQEQLLNGTDELLDNYYWVVGKNYNGPLSLREILSSFYKKEPVELSFVYPTVDGPVVDYSSEIKEYDSCTEEQKEIMEKKQIETKRETGIKNLGRNNLASITVYKEKELAEGRCPLIQGVVKKLLDLGVEPKYIEETINLYVLAYYKLEKTKSEILYHKSGEKAGVPTSFSKVNYELLQSRVEFYQNQIKQLQDILLKSPVVNLSNEQKQKDERQIVENLKLEIKKVVAWYNACDRYAELNWLDRLKAKLTNKTIEKIDYKSMSETQLDYLYSTKKTK